MRFGFVSDILLIMFGTAFSVIGPLVLWDIARTNLVAHNGLYSLPFGYPIAWWIAGDLFIGITFLGVLLFSFGILRIAKMLNKIK
jgi:voltage-gated potassium channel Kch